MLSKYSFIYHILSKDDFVIFLFLSKYISAKEKETGDHNSYYHIIYFKNALLLTEFALP